MSEPVDLNFVTTDVWGGSVLQWATPFTNVKDMVDKAIAKLKPGQCIRRLVITGHGADHTDGFFVFDPDTSGAQLIDGGTKREPISPSVVKELQRLKAHFCKDAIIEFRVCRFGSGTNGQKAMQAVADATGVPITAPMGSISSLAAIGGLATDWRVAYPKNWGLSTRASFWRGGPTLPPQGAPSPGDIAPITGQVVPLRGISSPPQPTVLQPVRKVSIANPQPGTSRTGLATGGAVVLVVGLGFIWVASNFSPPATVAPAAAPTPSLIAVAPTVQATQQPTQQATRQATPAPATVAPTVAPTVPPTPQPTLSPAIALLPADGAYLGSGMFASYDGEESYATAWRVTKTGETVEIAQLVSPGGAQFQLAHGIVDPAGLLVAVSDDPGYCEVLVLESEGGQLADNLFVAYGPPAMTCPGAQELASYYLTLLLQPAALEPALRNHYDWGNDVVIGSVAIGGWTAD